MQWGHGIKVGLFAAGAIALAASSPIAGQKRSLAMLDGLVDGRWEMRIRGERLPAQRLCLMDGTQLIQLRHAGLNCERTIVEDSTDSVTVQYTCRGQGYGRTHIRRETPQLVQLDSQGVAGGLPFEFSAEVRRVGDCGH